MNHLFAPRRRSLLPLVVSALDRQLSSWRDKVAKPDHTIHATQAGKAAVKKYADLWRNHHYNDRKQSTPHTAHMAQLASVKEKKVLAKLSRKEKKRYLAKKKRSTPYTILMPQHRDMTSSMPHYLISYGDLYNLYGEAEKGVKNKEVGYILSEYRVGIVKGWKPLRRALLTRWRKPKKRGYKLNADASVNSKKKRYVRAWVCRNSSGQPVYLKGAMVTEKEIMYNGKPDSNEAEILALYMCIIEALPKLQDAGSIIVETDSKSAIEHLKNFGKGSRFTNIPAEVKSSANSKLNELEAKNVEIVVRYVPRDVNRLADYIARYWTAGGEFDDLKCLPKDEIHDKWFWWIVKQDKKETPLLSIPSR